MEKTSTNKKKTNKVAIILVIVAAVVLVGFGIFYFVNKNSGTTAGAKTVTVTIVTEANENIKTVSTDEEFLGNALLNEKLIEGTKGEYGLFVQTVDGVTADETKEEWWCVTKGGGDVMTAIDATPIADGDAFELTLTVGY